jgi:hypothetical protein
MTLSVLLTACLNDQTTVQEAKAAYHLDQNTTATTQDGVVRVSLSEEGLKVSTRAIRSKSILA